MHADFNSVLLQRVIFLFYFGIRQGYLKLIYLKEDFMFVLDPTLHFSGKTRAKPHFAWVQLHKTIQNK